MDALKTAINSLIAEINNLRLIVEDLEERIEILEGDTKAWLTVNAGGENDGGNQTLIAAAPDMYEALSLIYKIHCEDAFRLADKDYIAITKAAAALALAEGRSTE